MIRNSVLAALCGVWAVSLPSDLHIVQRALLVVGFVPLLRMAYHLWQKRIVASRILILGNGPLVSKLIEELESSPDTRYVLTGVLDNEPLREGTRAAWLGRLDRWAVIVDEVAPIASSWRCAIGAVSCRSSRCSNRGRGAWLSKTRSNSMSGFQEEWPSKP